MNRKIGLLFILAIVILSAISGAIVGVFISGYHQQDVVRPQQIYGHSDVTSNVSVGEYSDLYRETIDSVVMVRPINNNEGYSIGSGFIYSGSGYIVTNEHVVAGTNNVWVRFRDGSWQKAKTMGKDVYTDLAVLKVDNIPRFASPLPIKSDSPRPGQRIAALGSPFGLEGSITSGIVSGVNRSMTTSGGFSIPATIQIDAPLNPGNSGGPLLNMNGTVIGVNRATQGDNVGFAISPLFVDRIIPRLIENGKYKHSYLGVRMKSITPIVAQENNLSSTNGVLVVETIEDGPAYGILQPSTSTTSEGVETQIEGDIITSINGYKIKDIQDISRFLMLNTRPGQKINITVKRDGKQITETLTLTERPNQ